MMWLLIRMAGIGAIANSAEKTSAQEAIAKRLKLCMALKEVEQRRGGGVKRLQSLAAQVRKIPDGHSSSV